jgi:beta-galactosidase
MHGIKGFSRYMLVERDRWLDSPVRRDGRVREDHAAMFGRVNEILSGHSFVDLRRQADILLLANRDYDRLEAASVLVSFPGDFLETPSGFSEYPTFLTVSEAPLGFDEPIQVAKAEWFSRCYRGLADSGCAFLLSDTALPPERWGRFKVVVLSSFEYLDGTLQRSLLEFARAGGGVVLGPRLPGLDTRMRPDTTLAAELGAGEAVTVGGTNVGSSHRVGAGRIVHLTDLSDPAAALAAALDGLDVIRFQRNDARLDVAVHRGDDPARSLVFVANPTGEPIEAQIGLGFELSRVRELWGDRDVASDGTTFDDALAPYDIKIYECLTASREG